MYGEAQGNWGKVNVMLPGNGLCLNSRLIKKDGRTILKSLQSYITQQST